jgi:hypothetical protein
VGSNESPRAVSNLAATMRIFLFLAAFALCFVEPSRAADKDTPASIENLEASVKAAKDKVATEFKTAAAIRQAADLIDPDPEGAGAKVTINKEKAEAKDKEQLDAYLQAKARYLQAKTVYEAAVKKLQLAKEQKK